jgi:hypothetical protein
MQYSLRDCIKQHQQLLMYVFISELQKWDSEISVFHSYLV